MIDVPTHCRYCGYLLPKHDDSCPTYVEMLEQENKRIQVNNEDLAAMWIEAEEEMARLEKELQLGDNQ